MYPKTFERVLEVTDEEFEYLNGVQCYERGQTTSGVLDMVECQE